MERLHVGVSMKFVLSLFFGLFSLAPNPAIAHTGTVLDSGPVTIVTIKVSSDHHELNELAKEGYDIAGVDLEKSTADIVVHEQVDGLALRFKGFSVLSMKPFDTRLAPDSNYKTHAEVTALLQQYAADFPNITRLQSVGQTREGRDIWALKITDNPDTRELDEPTILFNGMHHAREVMSVEVPLDAINFLLSNYGVLSNVTGWIDTTEIWIMPMLNADGNNKVWNGNSMWRKNTFNGYGIDINRNYPYGWNSCNGSSGSTSADDYRGPSPASEPETQAMMNLVARIQPVFSISFHSYSELVLYPYGCRSNRTATREIVESIGQQMAALVPRDSGRGTYTPGTPWELLYNADGGDIDWMYTAHHVIPYVVELNGSSQGFQPPFSYRQPTVEKVRAAWSLLLNKLSASGVRGVIRDGSGRTNPDSVVTVRSLTAFPALDTMTDINWPVKADGTYHLVLLPGTYHLTFTSNGRRVEQDVTVGSERVDLDIEL
jgi:hypothetical protein